MRDTLLDELDTDGQRFVVAIDNGPPTRTPRGALSKREHQVLTQAHLGHSNKVIAYELGLSAATVRVLLHRAARKLGVSSRADAIARFDKIVHPDDVESCSQGAYEDRSDWAAPRDVQRWPP